LTDEIDKKAVWEALKTRLQVELREAQKRAKDAAEGVTHEENRAESDKDMRSTEASYVARGQASRAVEIEEALLRVGAVELRRFGPGDRIAVSALVELDHDGKRLHYFLVPAAGGQRLTIAGREVQTLTTQSPLGRALLGLSEGDEAELPPLKPGEPTRSFEVLRVR
jgi:transcription elongation GreA/GreB family factor